MHFQGATNSETFNKCTVDMRALRCIGVLKEELKLINQQFFGNFCRIVM